MTTCVTVPLGPACANITGVRAGDRNQFTVTVTNQGQPIDLTGQTVTAPAAASMTSTTASSGSGSVVDVLRACDGATDLWIGTQAQYDAIGTKSPTTVYAVT
jgi:hypothetical protein